MPAITPIFLLGLALGMGLLAFGVLLGYWLGRKATVSNTIDRRQFLAFLRDLSNWTSEFSGDVGKYQSQLTLIDERVRTEGSPPREEILELLSKIMQANSQLQARLDSTEQKLEVQTDQISSYLTEARTDGLTGLLNRRAFDHSIDQLFAEWTRKGQPFSLGLIDIDHFKQINDTYGHPAGDAVLKHISTVLQTELGDSVCVARYGGEEFAVLTKSSAEATADVLDQLRELVSRTKFSFDERDISITISSGAAHIEPEDSIGELVRRADEALYAAKLGGRNRIYLHDGTVCHLVTKVAPVDNLAEVRTHLSRTESPSETHEDEAHRSRIHERLQRIVAEESGRVIGR